MSMRPGDCEGCRNVKKARPLPQYMFSRTKDATSKVVWRRAA